MWPAAGGGPRDLHLPGDLRVQPRVQGERPQVGGRHHSGAREAEGGSGETYNAVMIVRQLMYNVIFPGCVC